jgi:hypothetical protein
MPWVRKPAMPSVVPSDPVVVAPPCPPLETSAEQTPVATTKEDLLGPGTLATAIVAPKGGDIPVKAGTPVVLIAHHLMDSPTVKKLLRVVYAAWVVFAGYVGVMIVAHGSIWGLNWAQIGRHGVDLGIISALAGYGISLKSKDNDPVVSASWSGSAAADAADATKGITK